MPSSAPSAPCIATAGWAIPRPVAEMFPTEGSGLQRYAARFDGVEINSTFYRPHRPATLLRWAQTTPPGFRFALKLPRAITHEERLVDCRGLIEAFRRDAEVLGDKLGPLLVQLPPSLQFDTTTVDAFMGDLRAVWPDAAVCEPRHVSWFEPAADEMLRAWRVGRVAADPQRHPLAGAPGGWDGIAYWRLHGSPRMYYSAYSDADLAALASRIRDACAEAWCVFDNTTSGAAMANALTLQSLLAAA